LDLTINELKELIVSKIIPDGLVKNIIIALPPFIPEEQIDDWKITLTKLRHKGFDKFMCAHAGQKIIIPPKAKIFADRTIWCLNKTTQQTLKNLGFNRFTYSPEDDMLNLKATGSTSGLITLFGHIPLFISRIPTPPKEDTFLKDARKNIFFLKKRYNLNYLIGKKPLCLTHRKQKLLESGISSFVLDFSFFKEDLKLFNEVLSHYNTAQKISNTTVFNLKGGLR
jgi:hypothetical protein